MCVQAESLIRGHLADLMSERGISVCISAHSTARDKSVWPSAICTVAGLPQTASRSFSSGMHKAKSLTGPALRRAISVSPKETPAWVQHPEDYTFTNAAGKEVAVLAMHIKPV